MVALINPFEVPAAADDPFIAGWERARDFLAAKGGLGATALHRALRPDAHLRFVNVARIDSAEAWREAIADPAFPGRGMPFTAHPGLYEVVHEEGEPDATGGVILINPFEVPAEADAAFVAGWQRARGLLAERPGYLGTRLHRSVGPADYRFVNVARWSSPLMFSRAIGSGDFEGVGPPFPSHPALYQVVRS